MQLDATGRHLHDDATLSLGIGDRDGGLWSFPPTLLCIKVDSRLMVTMGTGWPVPVASTDALLLVSSTHDSGRSTAIYRANSIGVANLQATWEPPVGSAVTSVQWSQAVRVVPSG